jgi:hypothetical protein
MLRSLLIFILFPLSLQAQIKIDHAGDFWEIKVQDALDKVKSVDSIYYNLIVHSCDNISFWNGKFSTNSGGGINQKGTIIISRGDILLNDIDNLCAVLIHESVHLQIIMSGRKFSEAREEFICYSVELEYLRKVPGVGVYLIQHAESQITKYKALLGN